MRRLFTAGLALLALAAARPHLVQAQAQPPVQNFLAVGEMAPDFSLPGATRYGVLQNPLRLSDFRGKTVVLAFFYRVRGGG